MTEQEKAFWEIWDKIEPHHEHFNHRQMFDLGYEALMKRVEETADYLCSCDHDSRCPFHQMLANVKGQD